MNAVTETRAAAEDVGDITEIVASLSGLRAASQRRRYPGDAPELPSRAKTIAIVDAIVSALYPRHFGPQGLDAASLDTFVADTLRSALRGLERQVRLEIALHALGDGSTAAEKNQSKRIANAFATALPRVRALADSDARAGFEGDPSATSIDEVVFSFPGFAAILRHRIAHPLYTLGAPVLARIIAEDAHSRTGVDIHPGADIGERFFIDHGTGVVIGETAIIGRNVRLYQAVTLGAKRFETEPDGALRKSYPRHPIVEDDVVIYAGATILGRVTIGKGSSVGGNVWLTRAVPPHSRISQAELRHESFDDGAGI